MFFVNQHLLERRVVEDVCEAPVVNQNLACVIVPYSDGNNERIIVWVVETPGIFLCKPNDKVVKSH